MEEAAEDNDGDGPQNKATPPYPKKPKNKSVSHSRELKAIRS